MRDPTFTAQSERIASSSSPTATVRWREAAAPHLQTAIVELERAIAAMPSSYERLLLNRALRTCALSFRECNRNLNLLAARKRTGHFERPRGVRA